jgi:hypothetical protein
MPSLSTWSDTFLHWMLIAWQWLGSRHLDYGNVPTWVVALAAVIGARFAYRAHALARRREQRFDVEQRWAQAVRVGAWLGDITVNGTNWPVAETGFIVRNASELPIYDLTVWASLGPVLHRRSWTVANVPPGEDAQAQLPEEVRSGRVGHGYSPRPVIAFRDTAGRQWHRDADGRLREGPLPEWPDEPTEH